MLDCDHFKDTIIKTNSKNNYTKHRLISYLSGVFVRKLRFVLSTLLDKCKIVIISKIPQGDKTFRIVIQLYKHGEDKSVKRLVSEHSSNFTLSL